MVTNVCAKFPYGPLRIKKALGIFRKVVTRRRRTTVIAIWDPSRVQKLLTKITLVFNIVYLTSQLRCFAIFVNIK